MRIKSEMISDDLPTDALWYLATPYSQYPDGQYRAFIEACKAAGALMKVGIGLVCPIAHGHPIAEYGRIDKTDHQTWGKINEPLLRASFGCIVYKMPSWETSLGMMDEIEYFRGREAPVYSIEWYIEPPLSDGARDARNYCS